MGAATAAQLFLQWGLEEAEAEEDNATWLPNKKARCISDAVGCHHTSFANREMLVIILKSVGPGRAAHEELRFLRKAAAVATGSKIGFDLPSQEWSPIQEKLLHVATIKVMILWSSVWINQLWGKGDIITRLVSILTPFIWNIIGSSR